MPRNLILFAIVIAFHGLVLAQKKPSSKTMSEFQTEVAAVAEVLINSQLKPSEKLAHLKAQADLFGDHWFALIQSGAAKADDLLSNNSDYSRSLLTYQNFILLSHLRTEGQGARLKVSRSDCREKLYQMQNSYIGFGAIHQQPPTREDQIIENLRRNLCGEK